MVDLNELPLFVAFASSILINFPQLYQTWRTRDVSSFSSYTIILRIISHACWFVYAMLIQEWMILSISGLNGVSEAILLAMKYKWIKDDINVRTSACPV